MIQIQPRSEGDSGQRSDYYLAAFNLGRTKTYAENQTERTKCQVKIDFSFNKAQHTLQFYTKQIRCCSETTSSLFRLIWEWPQ